MRLFPQLVFEKYGKRVFDVLIPNDLIVRGFRIVD
jgi:hypothetical protein